MRFCIQCGNQLSDDARFCARCGTRVEPVAPVMTEPVAEEPVYTPPVAEPVVEYAAPVYQPPVQEEPVYQNSLCEEPVPQTEPPVQESVWEPTPQEPEVPVYADPVEPVYVPPVAAPEKVEKKPLIQKKPLGIGKKILVVFLCVLAFIFGTATVMALCIRSTVTADNVAEFIGNVELSEVEATVIIADAEKEATLADWLIEQLEKRGIDCSALDTSDVEDFLEACIIPFVQDEAQEFASALLTGKGKASITLDEIREVVEDSRSYLFRKHGVVMTDENVGSLVRWIDSFGVTEMANTRYLEKEYGETLDTVRLVLSWAAVAVFGALTLVFLVLIWITNKSLIRNLNSTGIVATAIGGMFAVFTVINLVFPGLLLTICGSIDLVYSLVSMVITSGTTVILSTLGAGVLLLVVSRLLQIKVRK